MKKNMGTADKGIRLLLAAIFIGLFVSKLVTGALGIVLLVVAGVFVLTSVVSFCPLYTIAGVKTCSTN